MSSRLWAAGDRVMHPGMPEWGVGEIMAAAADVQNSVPCQRLTVRFARGGTRTLSTAFAKLEAATGQPAIAGAVKGGSWLDAAEAADPMDVMIRLPERATDPFTAPSARLQATLALYRFTGAGGSLVDWAAAQSGLADPLTRFSRHELEEFFARFRAALDAHAKRLALDVKRSDPEAYRQAAAKAPPGAQHLLRRLDTAR